MGLPGLACDLSYCRHSSCLLVVGSLLWWGGRRDFGRFFEPFGRPGPGRAGLGESAGVPIRARSRRKPSRTLLGLRGLAGSGRGCQGRRRSSTRCRARRSWAYAPMARDTHRSVAAAELRCALARPR
jgi:hypothetical protein